MPDRAVSLHDPHQLRITARIMEAVNLRYSTTYKIIICLECKAGLPSTGIAKHLRREHRVKNPLLHAALEETGIKQLSRLESIPTPPNGQSSIADLAVLKGFQCQLPDCNNEPEALSRNRDIV